MPGTLIIGDEISDALYSALSASPGLAGGIWHDSMWGSVIATWAAKPDELQKVLDYIKSGSGSDTAPSASGLPDKILVSLGRADILTEPEKPDANYATTLYNDLSTVVDQLKATSLKIIWIMPPIAQNEGVTRDVITKALTAKGIRIFPSRGFTDSSVRGKLVGGKPADIPQETYNRMAQLLITWVPLGPFIGVIGPRRTGQAATSEGGFAGYAAAIPGQATTWFSALSTGGKLGVGLGAAAILGGAIYYGARRHG